MEKTLMLKKNRDFRRLYSKGKTAGGKLLVIYCRPNNRGINRLGITVSKKIGNAVKRNRARRIIKEAYRLNEHRLKAGYDLVIISRFRTVFSDMNSVSAALIELCKKLSLLEEGK